MPARTAKPSPPMAFYSSIRLLFILYRLWLCELLLLNDLNGSQFIRRGDGSLAGTDEPSFHANMLAVSEPIQAYIFAERHAAPVGIDFVKSPVTDPPGLVKARILQLAAQPAIVCGMVRRRVGRIGRHGGRRNC